MTPSQLPLTLIVAATSKNGIGKNGGLPWPMLKADMAYFARVTKRVPVPKNTGSPPPPPPPQLDAAQRNVVIMGRKTWDSIPPKFRPLRDRVNIVISSQARSGLQPMPDDVFVAPDILSGLQSLTRAIDDGQAPPVGRVFVIGGSSIYRAALELLQTRHILLTRISKPYDCDTFFPQELNDGSEPSAAGWQRRSRAELADFVGEDVADGPMPQQVDGEEVELEFQLHERCS